MLMLPSQTELSNTTVTELAHQIYPALVFDTALPIDWVKQCTERGFNPVGSVVWGYPLRSLWGQPYPLTQEAALTLCALTGGLR